MKANVVFGFFLFQFAIGKFGKIIPVLLIKAEHLEILKLELTSLQISRQLVGTLLDRDTPIPANL